MLEPLEKVADLTDEFIHTREEQSQVYTERQRIDLTSPYKLPHLIRPLTLIFTAFLFLMVVVAELFGHFWGLKEIDHILSGIVATAFTTAMGFYFRNRTLEKQVAKRAQNEERRQKQLNDIEEKKLKHELRMQEKKESHEVKMFNKREKKRLRREFKHRSRGE